MASYDVASTLYDVILFHASAGYHCSVANEGSSFKQDHETSPGIVHVPREGGKKVCQSLLYFNMTYIGRMERNEFHTYQVLI